MSWLRRETGRIKPAPGPRAGEGENTDRGALTSSGFIFLRGDDRLRHRVIAIVVSHLPATSLARSWEQRQLNGECAQLGPAPLCRNDPRGGGGGVRLVGPTGRPCFLRAICCGPGRLLVLRRRCDAVRCDALRCAMREGKRGRTQHPPSSPSSASPGYMICPIVAVSSCPGRASGDRGNGTGRRGELSQYDHDNGAGGHRDRDQHATPGADQI